MSTDVERRSPAAGVTPTAVALKEWGAAVHALLQGRQRILLRKGGIHEKAFVPPSAGGGFLLYPTVAHTHAERTRPEHRDLLPLGAADADEAAVTIRAGVHVVDVVEVSRPERLPDIAEAHIWTDASIRVDRVEFRPKHPLQVLVVQAVALAVPVRLARTAAHGGCRSWVEVEVGWDGGGDPVVQLPELEALSARVRDAVG